MHQNQRVGVGKHVFKTLNPHPRHTESASLITGPQNPHFDNLSACLQAAQIWQPKWVLRRTWYSHTLWGKKGNDHIEKWRTEVELLTPKGFGVLHFLFFWFIDLHCSLTWFMHYHSSTWSRHWKNYSHPWCLPILCTPSLHTYNCSFKLHMFWKIFFFLLPFSLVSYSHSLLSSIYSTHNLHHHPTSTPHQ